MPQRISISWRSKALLPLVGVLLGGLAVFLYVSLAFESPQREKVLLVAAGGAVAICAVMLTVLAVLVERPLAELREKIALVRQGDLNVTVGFSDRRDEIGDLGRDFNDMVRQLRESREEIQRLLAATRSQMSRTEHLATLGELAAGLAHEIRNPLAGIAGVLNIAGRDLPPSSPSREVLQEAQRETEHIQRILSDLLDYTRPKAPAMQLADLNATVQSAASLARQQILSRPIELAFQPAPDLPPLEHDPRQIQQVFVNLLLNAIQAIPESGRVRVSVEAAHGEAIVRVADNGRGIPPEHFEKIFRPFFTTKGQGTGLGLSLSKRIIEGHGGQIEVASGASGGTEFAVRLPLGKPAQRAAS